MKKILVSMFLLVFSLCLVGCDNIGNNKLLRNQAGYEWLDDINIENIEKVQIEFGEGMTYIGNTRSIYSSIDTEVIKDIFDYYYNCKVEQYSKDKEGVMDAGSGHTKIYLNTGEVKEITIIGMYLKDSNGIDFKVKSPYRMDESKFVRTFKFVTDEDTFELYTLEGLRLGSFSGLSEYEFIEYPYDHIEENEDLGYIETEFGRIYIHSYDVFYIKDGNVHEFYLITSERTFYDLFSMDDIE